MTISPHFLTGATLATTTQSYSVAFLLGFLSHFVLDAIPHLDPGTFFNIAENENPPAGPLRREASEAGKPWPVWIYIFSISEFVIIIIAFYFLFHNRSDFAIMSVGGIGGIVVDVLDNTPLRFLRKWPVFRELHWLHEFFHHELPPNKWYWGLPSEIIIIGGTICLLWLS